MAVVFDSFTSAHRGTAGSSDTVTGVAVANNANRVLDFLIGVGNTARAVSSVTRDGQSANLVFAHEATADVRVEVWRIVAPNTGTANASVTYDGSFNEAVIGVLSAYGVNQTTPSRAPITQASSAYLSSFAATPESQADDLVIDALWASTGGAAVTHTPGAGQTEMLDNNATSWRSFAISRKSGAAGTTAMGQTTSTTAVPSVYVAYALASATGGGSSQAPRSSNQYHRRRAA